MVAIIDGMARGASGGEGGENKSAELYAQTLLWLARLLAHSGGSRSHLARHERQKMAAAVKAAPSQEGLCRGLAALFRRLGYEEPLWRDAPGETELPLVALIPGVGFRHVRGRSADGAWLAEGPTGRERIHTWPPGVLFTAAHALQAPEAARTARAMFMDAFRRNPGWIYQAALASVLASVLVLGTSLYSLQVYDRVLSSGAMQTLIVLTIGVAIAVTVELAVKVARSVIVDRATSEIDHQCAHGVFARLLAVRFDQRPGSVGTLASQVRSYEAIRGFAMSLILFLTMDGPFALFFLFVIYLLGGPMVAAVPLLCLVLSVGTGLIFKRRIERNATTQASVGNRRNGLLVEAIEGAESIKATGVSWRVLGQWNELSRQNIDESMEIKHLNDLSAYLAAALQQISYIGLVAAGAWVAVTSTEVTQGAIVACSILSGRVLTPMSMVPGLLVQWAHAKVALDSLEKLFALEVDNHGVDSPLVPERIAGRLEVQDVEFVYPGQIKAVAIARLVLQPGEKIAILGPIGAGKSTLLRLLGGLAKPRRGQVLLDGMDIHQIAAEHRAEHLGYLPQQVGLLCGTLRDNLLAGLPAVSDERLLAACEATGLSQLIAGRSEGLDIPIAEGGGGLSGGQKQLLAVTRLLLSQPAMWLLDEPTAAMDEGTEARCLAALRSAIRPEQTLVLVTHKAQLLGLVDRIIVLTPAGIAIDGPRDEVLAQLRKPPGPVGAPPPAPVVVRPKEAQP